MHLHHTYTVVTLAVPQELYDHIAVKLRAAGYGHAFGDEGMIDMTGIGLIPDASLKMVELQVKDPFDPDKYRDADKKEEPKEKSKWMLDCAGGMPCSDCPDKKKCDHGCIHMKTC
jgi:hypothetical protein